MRLPRLLSEGNLRVERLALRLHRIEHQQVERLLAVDGRRLLADRAPRVRLGRCVVAEAVETLREIAADERTGAALFLRAQERQIAPVLRHDQPLLISRMTDRERWQALRLRQRRTSVELLMHAPAIAQPLTRPERTNHRHTHHLMSVRRDVAQQQHRRLHRCGERAQRRRELRRLLDDLIRIEEDDPVGRRIRSVRDIQHGVARGREIPLPWRIQHRRTAVFEQRARRVLRAGIRDEDAPCERPHSREPRRYARRLIAHDGAGIDHWLPLVLHLTSSFPSALSNTRHFSIISSYARQSGGATRAAKGRSVATLSRTRWRSNSA